jgi:ribonuclease BN (tRNA processing enzyme)
VRVVPLGVRGSTPAPGAAFVRYGGDTSCLAVLADDAEAPHLVLDAGTGLSGLPGLLGGAPFTGAIVLSHLHWDHMQGLPFCPAIDRPDATVRLHVPVGSPGVDPGALLAQGFSPPHFPITPDGLLGDWQVLAVTEGDIDDSVGAVPIAHKGGVAFGIRVELAGARLAYLPDHALHADTSQVNLAAARGLAGGADLLVHDGQFVAAEGAVAVAYGHATIERVLSFADECEVGALVLTHHAPTRTDDQLDALAQRYVATPQGRPVSFARQGEPILVRAPDTVHRT